MPERKTLLWKIFFALAAAESAAAFYALAAIPSEAGGAALFGFSAFRLAEIAFAALILILALVSLARTFSSARFSLWLNDALSKKSRFFALLSGILAAAGLLFLLLPPQRVGEARYVRLLPLAALLTLLALQGLASLFFARGENPHWERLKPARPILAASVFALAGFFALWVFIAFSGIGIIPQKTGWLAPGAPILFQQLLFAWALAGAFLIWGARLERISKTDALIALAFWLAAALLWNAQPMTRWGYFTPEPTPPNFEYYPHSDAALYDHFAQNILIGSSRQIDYTIRPLYAIFLALLHWLFGQKFETLIVAQVSVLAVMPAFVYLLGRRLGLRASGILAAALIVFREMNAIAATNLIEVSHSKLLMSDLPAATTLVLFVYFLVAWFQDSRNQAYLGALAGAFFGATLLIRSQAQMLLPIILLWIWISKRDGWKAALQKSAVFLLGVFLAVSPWVWRNYRVSGKAIIEYQDAYTVFFAGNYADAPEEIQQLPGEDPKDYASRMNALIVRNLTAHPEKFIPKFLSYTLHNEVLSLAYLPLNWRFADLHSYLKGEPLWQTPAAPIPARNLLVFFLYLCLISVGLAVAFRRAGWMGILPLFLHFAYNFSVTFIFISGWRFIQPMDWAVALYAALGLIQATAWALALFSLRFAESAAPIPEVSTSLIPASWKRAPLVLGLVAVLGISLPLFEASFPERYPALPSQTLIEKYLPGELALPEGGTLSPAQVAAFLQNEPRAFVAYGRALYPAYYKRDDYWGDAVYLTQAKLTNRVEFKLIGANRVPVFLPLAFAPAYFPHAAEVFALGCQSSDAVRALMVKVNDRFLFASPWNGLTCDEP